MNWKRAVSCGALLWVLIFFEVSILMFGFKFDSTNSYYYLAHYPLAVILIAIASLIYFRKAKAGFGQGFLVGITFIVTGIFLDSVITMPLFMRSSYSFLIRSDILIGYLLTLIVTGVVGAVKR